MAEVRTKPNILVWGSDGYGRLGQDTIGNHKDRPIPVPFFSDKLITSIACGSAHTLVTVNNPNEKRTDCYSWGKCHCGQLGHGEMDEDQATPKLMSVFFGISIKFFSCGESFSFAVTDLGQVYSWGCGYFGALGHGNEKHLIEPTIIETLRNERIKCIRGGSLHSLAVTEEGKLYSWGRDKEGQLGLPPYTLTPTKPRLNQYYPVQVPLEVQVINISAFSNHSMVLLGDNTLLTFGNNNKGQLGRPIPEGLKETPPQEAIMTCKVQLSERVTSIACGFEHSLVLTESGKMFSWGGGNCGELGHGDAINRDSPTHLAYVIDINTGKICTVPEFISIAAGHKLSLGLTKNGAVYSWGENYKGKLGRGYTGDFPCQVIDGEAGITGIIVAENHSTAYSLNT